MRHWQFFHALMSFSFYGCQDFSWHFHYCTFDEIIYPEDIRDSKSTSATVSSIINPMSSYFLDFSLSCIGVNCDRDQEERTKAKVFELRKYTNGS